MNYFVAALDLAEVAWISYKRKSRSVNCSENLHGLFNIPKGSIKSITDLSRYVPRQKEFLDIFEKLSDTNLRIDQDMLVFSSEGKYFWLELKLKYIGGEEDEIFATLKDISEEKKTSIEKKEIQDKQLHFKESLSRVAIIAETDIRGTITSVNEKFCDVTGYHYQELIGQNHRILNSGFHSKEFFKVLWKLISSGNVWNGRICNKNKNGELYWVETYIAPIFKKERVNGYLAIRFEITEQVFLEKRLREEEEKSRFNEQLAAIGEMSASIAHEIANPLAVINGSNNLIQKQIHDEEKVTKYSDSIKKAVSRIQKIIVGLKRISRKNQSHLMELAILHDIITETIGFCEESLRQQGIEIQLDDIPKDILVLCREVEISQVLLNLVNNAKDAICENKMCDQKWIKIKIKFIELDEIIKVRISDSGAGIPNELIEKVMESFFTTKKTGKGTGLGLSLVKRIIESHGGEFILVPESENTTFEFSLPRAQVAKQNAS